MVRDRVVVAVTDALHAAEIEMPADIVVLRGMESLGGALEREHDGEAPGAGV